MNDRTMARLTGISRAILLLGSFYHFCFIGLLVGNSAVLHSARAVYAAPGLYALAAGNAGFLALFLLAGASRVVPFLPATAIVGLVFKCASFSAVMGAYYAGKAAPEALLWSYAHDALWAILFLSATLLWVAGVGRRKVAALVGSSLILHSFVALLLPAALTCVLLLPIDLFSVSDRAQVWIIFAAWGFSAAIIPGSERYEFSRGLAVFLIGAAFMFVALAASAIPGSLILYSDRITPQNVRGVFVAAILIMGMFIALSFKAFASALFGVTLGCGARRVLLLHRTKP